MNDFKHILNAHSTIEDIVRIIQRDPVLEATTADSLARRPKAERVGLIIEHLRTLTDDIWNQRLANYEIAQSLECYADALECYNEEVL